MPTKMQRESHKRESNATDQRKSQPSQNKDSPEGREVRQRSRGDLTRLLLRIRRGEIGYKEVRRFLDQNNDSNSTGRE